MTALAEHRLSVLIVSQNYAPEPTGIGKYSGEMASWLATRGHAVTVLAAVPHYPHWRVPSDFPGNRYSARFEEGVTVKRVPVWLPKSGHVTTRARIALETSFNLLATRWWLGLLLRRTRPDVIVTVCPPSQAVLWPLAYSRLRGVPLLIHFQDLQVDAAVNLGMVTGDLARRLLLRAESWLMKRATHVTTISDSMLSRVRAKGVSPTESSLFSNWSNLSRVQPMWPHEATRRRLGAAADDVLFLYSGNIGEKQGLEVVLHAASRLQRYPHVKVAIVGAGANRARLEERAEELGASNVRFHDLFPSAELGQLLASGDVHLVIQRREAADVVMPSKLTNILASGRPCIVTADDGTELAHVVRAAGCGTVVAPDDPESLARVMLAMSLDAQGRSDAGRRARQFAERSIDHQVVLAHFEALLERISRAHPLR